MENPAHKVIEAVLVHIPVMPAIPRLPIGIDAIRGIIDVRNPIFGQRVMVPFRLVPYNAVIGTRCNQHQRIIPILRLQGKAFFCEQSVLMDAVIFIFQDAKGWV